MRLFFVVPATALFLSAVSPVLATNCNTVVACVLGQNSSPSTSSDIGVEGLSQYGFGLVGVTSASPTSASGRVAGLYGKDQGATTYNSGVSAFSQNGTGLIAFGVNGDGIHGITAREGATGASAVLGEDAGLGPENVGVTGTSTYGTGAAATSTYGNAVEAVAQNFGDGLFATSANGNALEAISYGRGPALVATGGFGDYSAVNILTFGQPLISGFKQTGTVGNSQGPNVFYIDAGGN